MTIENNSNNYIKIYTFIYNLIYVQLKNNVITVISSI